MSSPNSAEVSGSPSPAPSSIGNNAPKYGTLVPNRIFVGGISASTTEQDLLELFSQYGTVKATKIISDRAGVSKGYGFVTFETEDEARRLTQEADNIMLKDRKLNIAPAIKKQVSDVGYIKTYSPRLVETNNSMVGTGGTVFFSNGATYSTYGSTMPVISPAEYHPTFTQAPAAPPAPSAYQTIVYQQPMYYAQQYQYQPTQAVQAQWGAAPQWRWVTPASYPQPECSSQCLVEPSSLAHRVHTAGAMGNAPFTSTYHVLTTPSTSTPSSATDTITSTTVSTTLGASISTTSVSNIIATSTVVCDSLLLIKPLAAHGKPKSSPSLVSKAVRAVDDDDISSEVSKASEDAPSSTLHILEKELVNLHIPSKSTSQVTCSISSSITTASNETQTGVMENCVTMVQKSREPFMVQKGKEPNGDCVKGQEQTTFQTCVDSIRDCLLHPSSQPESDPSVETGENSAEIHNPKLNTAVDVSKLTAHVPLGVNSEAYPSLRHMSSCPRHGEEPLFSSSIFVPQQMSPFIMNPSWPSYSKPGTSSPSYDYNSKTTIACRSDHSVRYQVPPPSLVSQACRIPYSTPAQLPVSTEMSSSTPPSTAVSSPKIINSLVVDKAGTTVITTQASLVSSTNTVTSNTRSICSPVNNHSQYLYGHHSYYAAYPSSEANNYGYANQNMWMMMPSYQYWRAGGPCCQWSAPVLVHWPVPPAPYAYAATTLNSTPTTLSGAVSVSSVSSESYANDLHSNLQEREQNFVEDVSTSNDHGKQGDRSSNVSHLGENNGLDNKANLHSVPSVTSQRLKSGEIYVQKKQKGSRMSRPSAHSNCRSPPGKSITYQRRPDTLNSCQPIRMRNINAITEVDEELSLTHDNSSGLMPITPPPTPIFKSDSSATIVSDTNAC